MNPRSPLLETMASLQKTRIDCASCTGVCCTFVSNSMQVTPWEAYDMMRDLVEQGRWNLSLKETLALNVEHYRLDAPVPSDGRRMFSRRTYTCPFFEGKALGCSISQDAKPLGCLAFNPTTEGAKEGDGCRSDQDQLQVIEQNLEMNPQGDLSLPWAKLPIPVALLDLMERFPPS